jgi:hypothetical protein
MDHLPTLKEVPPAPRTPSPEAHRLIFGYQSNQRMKIIIGGLILGIGLILAVVLCWGVPGELAITLNPRTTKGAILQAEPDRSFRIGTGKPTLVRFSYEGGGTHYEGESGSFDIAPGQTGSVQVQYSDWFPGWGRLAGGNYSAFGFWSLLVLVVPLAGWIILRRAVRSNHKEIRTFTHGRPVMARVTFRGQDHSVSIEGQHPFLMRWEFKTDSGALHHGAISSMNLLDIKAFGEAEQIVVLYDPADPRLNTIFIP